MVAKRLLSYSLLVAVLLLATLIPANAAFAERPYDCAPEDREIPGNTGSPCKYDLGADRITTVEYSVMESTKANSCFEVLTFSPYNGLTNSDDISYVYIYLGRVDERGNTRGQYYADRLARFGRDVIFETADTIQVPMGSSFYLGSIIPQAPPGWPVYLDEGDEDITPSFYPIIQLEIDHDLARLNDTSEWLPMPANVNDFNLLMNDCLAGIEQRLENEAKLEETRQKVEAERLARERANKHAKAVAERQRLETEAANEALRLVRETELAKTQALVQELEREKIIIGIWREVVLEQQKGAEARAQITNRYLTEIEASSAEFKASVVAKAEEVRRLQEINAAITEAIIAHNDEVERQLKIQATREAEQRERLDDLHIEPPETETPALTPTATP